MTMLFLGTYLLIQHFIVVPTFQSLEQQYARDDVDRVETVILDRLDTLERQMFDWSWWDDTYEFVIDANDQYINNNLVDSSFPNLQIDMAYILDVNTRPVWAATYQLSDEGFEVNTRDEYVEESIHLLKQELNKVKFLSDKEAEVTHGIFFQQGLPIAFSIGPILTTNGEGPSRGYLVLGRKLDEFFVEEWGEKIKTPFSIERPDKMLASINDFSSYEYTTEILSKELLTSSKTYQLDGFPVFRINTQFTRKVTQGGLSSLKYTLFYSLDTKVSCVARLYFAGR
jgi:sensor domain CHASE-containing protein